MRAVSQAQVSKVQATWVYTTWLRLSLWRCQLHPHNSHEAGGGAGHWADLIQNQENGIRWGAQQWHWGLWDAWILDHNWRHYTTHSPLIIIRLSGNGTKTHDMRIFSCSVKTLLILSPHLRCRIESSCYVGNVSCRNNVICNLKYHHILLFQSLLCSQFWPRFIQNNGIWIN